jgi:soluble lytic murein transglycosylase-like protein
MLSEKASISQAIFVIVVLVGAISLFTQDLSASLYAYVDESGVLHFTNAPTDSRYRLVERKTFSPLLSRCIGRYDKEIQAISQQCRVDPDLVRSIIKVESDFNPLAISVKGAQGLMQLMPGTAQDLKVSNPFDPSENIQGGVKYLRYLMDLFQGDLVLALAAYNAGENAVLRYRSVPPYPETRAYVQKVLALFDPSLESHIMRVSQGSRTTPKQKGSLQSSSLTRRNQIYKQYRTLGGETVVVYTNIPVSRRSGIDW